MWAVDEPSTATRQPAEEEPVYELPCVLAEDGSLLMLHEEDRKLVYYWGRIAYQGSVFEPAVATPIDVWCRRRPGGRQCKGQLTITPCGQKSECPLIHWRCPECGDGGALAGWQGTAFDMAEHRGAELEKPEFLRFNQHEWRMLQMLYQPSRPVLSLLFSAKINPLGCEMRGSRTEFHELYRAFEGLCLEQVSPRARVAHLRLHRRIAALLNLRPYKPPHGMLQGWGELTPQAPGRGPRPIDEGPPRDLELELHLLDVEPMVSRTVHLPGGTTLNELHEVIQCVMAWEDCHLHNFDVHGMEYARPTPHFQQGTRDSRAVLVNQCLNQAGDRIRYTYDYGDNWRVDIRLKETRYPALSRPTLVAGIGGSPPEDCGGASGFDRLRRVLADANHAEHQELRDRMGVDFDPDALDVEALDQRLARDNSRVRPR